MTMEESQIKTAIIKLTSNKYKGFEYYYGNVNMGDMPEGDGEVELSFDYYITKNPNDVNVETKEFKQLLGDIICDIVVSEEEYDRTDNIESSDQD